MLAAMSEGLYSALKAIARMTVVAETLIGPVYIGSGVSVEDGATIEGPAWLGHGCVLRKNSRLVRSILFDYTRLSEGAVFEDLIASPQYVVDRLGRTTYPGDETSTLRWGDARA